MISGGCSKQAEDDGTHDDHDHASETAGSHADEVTLTADAVEHYGIKAEAAQLWLLKPTIAAPSRISLNQEAVAHVGSPLRGRVTEVKARAGDSVQQGQALLVIESPELGGAQAELLQRRTAATNSAPVAELAQSSWKRANRLYEQSQGISLTEVQRREAEYKAALTAQATAEALVVAAENHLGLLGMTQEQIDALTRTGTISPHSTIYSPIDGVVMRRDVALGELVGPEHEPLMVLADTRTLWVLADVPEGRLMNLAVGAQAWVTISPHAGGGAAAAVHSFEGTVAYISPLVDPVTRAAQVRVEVPASHQQAAALKPGMFAQTEIVMSTGTADAEPVVAVPGEAIQTVEGGPAIFVPVAGEPNTFAKRAVTIAKPVGGLVPVLSGLVEGEQYVATGTFILKAELGKASAGHGH